MLLGSHGNEKEKNPPLLTPNPMDRLNHTKESPSTCAEICDHDLHENVLPVGSEVYIIPHFVHDLGGFVCWIH